MGYPVFFYGLACPTRFEHRKPSGDLSHRQSKKGVRRRTGRAVAPRRLPMLCPLAVVIREGKQREGARTVLDGVVVPLDSEVVADMRDAAGIPDDGQYRGRFHPSSDIGMLECLAGGDLVQLPDRKSTRLNSSH